MSENEFKIVSQSEVQPRRTRDVLNLKSHRHNRISQDIKDKIFDCKEWHDKIWIKVRLEEIPLRKIKNNKGYFPPPQKDKSSN